MATAAVDEDEDVLTCTVCLGRYTDPCTLQCKHSFCRKCISDYVKTQADAVQNKMIPCPSCRQVTGVPDPSRPVDEWAGHLQPGHAVQELMATAKEDSTMEDYLCSPCQQLGDTTLGTVWCSECEEAYCQGCARFHSAMAFSRGHDVCDIKDVGQARRRKPKCNRHKDQLLQLYCKTCNVPHCQLCYVDHHRHCEGVGTLTSFVSDMRSELSGLNDELEKLETKTKYIVGNQKRRISLINTDTVSVVGDIKSACQKAVDLIKRKERQLIDQVEEITEVEINDLKAKVKLGNIQMQTYRQYSEYIKQALSLDSEVEVCDVYQVWKSGQMEISQEGNVTEGGNISSVRFSQQKQNIAEVIDSLLLGEIFITYLPTDLHSSPFLIKSVDTKVEQDEKAPSIHDVTSMDVGGVQTIVVTDPSNKCLKSFYIENNKDCHSRIQFSGEIRGLTQLVDNKVMVAVPSSHEIVTVAVTPVLKNAIHINTSVPYSSLSLLSPSTLAAGGRDSIDVLNMQGVVMKSITTHHDMNLLENSNFMCVSHNEYLLVSDLRKKNVTCLTSEGETVRVYPDTGKGKLRNPTGITTIEGDIFVADSSLKKVVKLSLSEQCFRDVLTSSNGIRDPQGLFVDKHGSLFICDTGKILKFVFTRKSIQGQSTLSFLSSYVHPN